MDSYDLEDMFELYCGVKDDLKFLVTSDVRAKILISLSERSKNLAQLRKETNLLSSTILHGMHQLELKNIVFRQSKTYSLSQTGEIVASKLMDMMKSVYALDNCKSLFLNHEIRSIPPELLKEVGCLKNSYIVRSTSTDIMRPHNVLSKFLCESRKVKHLSSVFFTPNIRLLFNNLEKNGQVHLLLTQEILDKMMEIVNHESLKNGLSTGGLKLGIIEDDTKISFTLGDNFMALGLYSMDGTYDLNVFLMSESEEGILWGEQLFNHYLDSSTEFKP